MITDFFDRGWSMDPTAVAYQMGEETWTYEQAGRLTHRVANGLLSLGLEREAKVAVLSPNSPASWALPV